MIEPNKLYPRQMNGPVISAFGYAVDYEFMQAERIQEYLYNLSIDTANETELENIGRLIGYVRPLVPEGFSGENVLLLGPDPITQDPEIGLAALGVGIGGLLSSVVAEETNFMGLGTYRKFLKSIAILKRYGVTLKSIDRVVSVVSDDYTISFDANNDIVVHFNQNIGYRIVWILTQLFFRIATSPQVLITAGGN